MTRHDALNPFAVVTPEDLTPEEAHRLFVNVFTDFNKVQEAGHTMIHGPRGSGKSMMFRYLLPDCQMLATGAGLPHLRFFGLLISVKNFVRNMPEFGRVENRTQNILLNELFLVVFVTQRLVASLAIAAGGMPEDHRADVCRFIERMLERLEMAGLRRRRPNPEEEGSALDWLKVATKELDALFLIVTSVLKRLAFTPRAALDFDGPLLGYADFLHPMLTELGGLEGMPAGPIYLLFDDADYLTMTQTEILNGWVATRTSAQVSVKISTQYRYKTLRTSAGGRVSSPHDYQEVFIAEVYTSRKTLYRQRVEAIIQKRLDGIEGIATSPWEFFPVDEEQEAAIKRIADEIKADWEQEGRGARPRDDALRYARPEFMRRLAAKRAGGTYSYAGFAQLVHLSSGVIRHFLETAGRMYAEEMARGRERIACITPSIQDAVVKGEAEQLLLKKFQQLFKEELSSDDDRLRRMAQDRRTRLYGLITALGGLFKRKLMSLDAERRVFSVAISGRAPPELEELFDLGVEFGYFHSSTIGNKDGTGRTRLYILTRRVAPFFDLDPNGFAGYLWVTADVLLKAVDNPEAFLRGVKTSGLHTLELEVGQGELFDWAEEV